MGLGRRAKNGQELLHALYKEPIMSVKQIQKKLNITAPSANALVAGFENIRILKEITGYKRNRLFSFEEYIKIFGK